MDAHTAVGQLSYDTRHQITVATHNAWALGVAESKPEHTDAQRQVCSEAAAASKDYLRTLVDRLIELAFKYEGLQK